MNLEALVSRPTTSAPAPGHGLFFGVTALVFATSAVATAALCSSMSAMGGMSMPGGWTMTMAWMRMPGDQPLAAAAAFVAMWTVMMVAMMLPSLVPMLQRYREAAATMGVPRIDWLTVVVSAGYFLVWTTTGVVVYPIGVALAEAAMRDPGVSRATPFLTGIAVCLAGLVQLTPWKAHQLACCRESVEPWPWATGLVGAAWRHGLRQGVRCVRCCANLMAILLVLGVMDLHVMILVTAGVTAERIAPSGERVARAVGIVAVVVGVLVATGWVGLG